MKLIYKFSLIALIAIFSASCTTTQKIQISGPVGTEIYLPGTRTPAGTIGNTGTTQVELKSDAYYAYLLSKTKDSDRYIPFALDYKSHRYGGCRFMRGLGMSLSFAGLGTMIAGTIACAVESPVGPGVLLGGVGGIGIGLAIGIPATQRMFQIDHMYGFKYLSHQSTNHDFRFTKPQLENKNKVERKGNYSQNEKANTQNHKTDKVAYTHSDKKTKSNKSTRTLRSIAVIDGAYIGKGLLSKGNEAIESYEDIVVNIEHIDKTTVNVRVYDSDGQDFFHDTIIYNAQKNSTDYILTHNEITQATITIDKNRNISYIHPRVEIDGEIYVLKITASLKK